MFDVENGDGNLLTNQPPSVGLYFSANDAVFDWALAFLESFRHFNPDLPCRLIPFNENCQRLISVADRYNFSVFEHPSFGLLEDIGTRLEVGCTRYSKYWFRRFAAFDGEFDQFAYFDTRSLILSNFAESFAICREYDLDMLYFDCAINQVYNSGEIRSSLVIDHGARGFISGRWFSRKGLFTTRDFLEAADFCERNRSQMNPRNTDQFFLNYLCDRRHIRMAPLPDIDSRFCGSTWVRQPGYVYCDNGVFYRWDHGGLDHKKVVHSLHWAGIKLSPAMPEAKWFYHFRDHDASFVSKVAKKILRVPTCIGHKLVEAARTQRQLNQIWHSIRK